MKILLLTVVFLVTALCESTKLKTPLDDRIDFASTSLTFLVDHSCRELIKEQIPFVTQESNQVKKNQLFFRVFENGQETALVPLSDPLSLVKNRSNDITIYIPGYLANAWFNNNNNNNIQSGFKIVAQAHKTGTFAALEMGDYLVSEGNYYRCALYTEQLGKHLAEALNEIFKSAEKSGSKLPSVKIIGQSLGAHVAGHAGNNFKILSNGKQFNEIWAIDPARPCFSRANKVLRPLDKEDANLVSVIHTTNTFGLTDRIGHYDYYYKTNNNNQLTFGTDGNLHSFALNLYLKTVGKTQDEINALFQ